MDSGTACDYPPTRAGGGDHCVARSNHPFYRRESNMILSYACHWMTWKVPALYFGNYSAALNVIEDLSLVRPDQSYREDQDDACIAALGDDLTAAYVVYTVESGEDR